MADDLIPCAETDLKNKEWFVRNKVPQEHRDDENNILANGGTLYDLWLEEAERILVNDLLKFGKPIRLEDIESLAQLTDLKAYKTLELLFRMNVKEENDVNDKRSIYFMGLYQNELAALPLKLQSGAQIVMQTRLIRC